MIVSRLLDGLLREFRASPLWLARNQAHRNPFYDRQGRSSSMTHFNGKNPISKAYASPASARRMNSGVASAARWISAL
jgi:hypothetical protein